MKEINEKFLPIGTVVKLHGGEKKAMITSYLIFPTGKAEIKDVYDYGACAFPQGIIDSKSAIGFNHSDISEVIHMGLEDDDYNELNSLLKKHCDEFRTKFMKAVKSNKDKDSE